MGKTFNQAKQQWNAKNYLNAMPANLDTSPMHEAAEQTVSALDEALNSLYNAF